MKSVSEKIEKVEPQWADGGKNVKWCRCHSKQSDGPSNVYYVIITQSSNSAPRFIPERIEIRDSKRYYRPMFTAALFIIHKRQRQLRYPPTDKWAVDLRYIHTMEYYLVLKRNEVLTYTTKWMDLENMMLREIHQTQKDKYCMTACLWGTQNSQMERHKVEQRFWGRQREQWELLIGTLSIWGNTDGSGCCCWLHSIVRVLNATELPLKGGRMVRLLFCIFYYSEK